MSEESETGKYLALSTLGYVVDREIGSVQAQLDNLKSWDVDEDTWHSGYKAALKWVAEQIEVMS